MGSGERTILVVEDCIVTARILEHTLLSAGFKVAVARDGREAWEATQVTQFDMIVTDHQMRFMSGVELCEKLRQTERYSETPIVMITSKGFELDMWRLHGDLHVSALLFKPFNTAEVRQVVEDSLGELTSSDLADPLR